MGILALGGEEKPDVLMLQIYTMPKAYYTAHAPFRHGSALDALKTLAAPDYHRQ